MYKTSPFLFSISILALCIGFQINLKAEMAPCYSRDSIIVINPYPLPNNPPKTPSNVPISASYETITSSVILWFSQSMGVIGVDVLNSTNGGFCSYNIDTQYLYAIIPINLGSGHYILTFTLPSGQQYQGEFNKP